MKRVIERTKAKQVITAKAPVQHESVQLDQARIDQMDTRPTRRLARQLLAVPQTDRRPCGPSLWAVVSNGEAVARFHHDYHSEWQA
jgi:hypothetical protein